MPSNRFYKLKREKQEFISEVALEEFSTLGFEKASMNNIIKKCNISKGAMYYYFDSKRDLYCYSLSYFISSIAPFFQFNFEFKSKEEYWNKLYEIGEAKLIHLMQHEELLVLARDFISEYSKSPGDFNELIDSIKEFIIEIILKGQAVGAIRSNLPMDFIINLYMGILINLDVWLFGKKNIDFTALDMGELLRGYFELIRAVFEPGYIIKDQALNVFNNLEVLGD